MSLPFLLRFPFVTCFRNHGSHFEAHKAAFEEGAAHDDGVIEEEVLKELSESSKSGGKRERVVVVLEEGVDI